VLIFASVFLISNIKFEESINDLAPNDEEISLISNVFANSSLVDKIVIRINNKNELNTVVLTKFADSLNIAIQKQLDSSVIKEVRAKMSSGDMLGSMDFMFTHLPIFLEDSDYVILEQFISEESIAKSMAANYRVLTSPANFGFKKFILQDPLSLNRLATSKLNKLREVNGFQLVDNYIFTADKSNLLIFIELKNSQNTALINVFDNKLSEIIGRLESRQEFNNVDVHYFGGPLVAASNANQIKKDIILTVSLALVLLLFLISYYYRSKRSILIIFIPTFLAAIISLALLSVIQVRVSLISIGVGSVLLGISVDYALHIYSHYRRNQDFLKLFVDVGQPIIISAFTTSAAFFSLMALESKVITDLGLFLGISILFSAFFSLFLFPMLLPTKGIVNTKRKNVIDRIAAIDFSKNKYVLLGILVITILFVFMNHESRFTSDLNGSNYMNKSLRESESSINNLIGLDSSRNMFVASYGRNLEQALQKNEEAQRVLQNLNQQKLTNYEINAAALTPSIKKQKERIAKWNRFWTKEKKDSVLSKLHNQSDKYGFKITAFSKFEQWLEKPIAVVEPASNPLYNQFVKDFVVEFDSKTFVLSQLNVVKNEEIQNQIISVVKSSKAQIVDKLYFTKSLLNKLKIGFDKLAIYSLGLVFLILLISYGRIELAIISFAPVSISWLWILAGMNIFGLEFNIFNVIILSFVFGLGIDYSVFYLRSLILKHKYGEEESETYRASILISALTSIIGIGVLVFAKHPAMRSIALTSIIGINTIVIVTFTFLPAAFRWITEWKNGRPREKAITFIDTLTSILFFTVYVTGAVTLTLLVPLFIIFPAPKKKKKFLYHYIVQFFSAHIFLHPTIPIKIINEYQEKFKEPAIIVSNHQSVIDIMLMLLLHPKILIVTNERVWKHWLWGAILRYADYYPAFAGYDNMMADIKRKVKYGYSLMVFPEGTRSIEGEIRRFHKGAFMMAKELNLPILPIMLHGVNETLRKGEFFLFSGKISLKIMPRIEISDLPYDESVAAVAKKMTQYYRSNYEEFRKEVADVNYYSLQLKRNFLYKGPVLEWYFKVKFRMENKYKSFDSWIPRDAKVIDLGCGYGFLDLMLAMVSPQRNIIGVDFDEEKIKVAQNSSIRRKGVSFVAADVTSFQLENADVFLILDTLHYFSRDKQIALIKDCISHLNTNGKILIRDANTDLKEKHKGTELTEKMSTGIGFNKAKFSDMDFISSQVISETAKEMNCSFRVLDESKHLSNLIYEICLNIKEKN
jgi:1-acyl-sn-glycerol-3-phosphate acyltransferase